MKPSIREMHNRLHCTFEMIEDCDRIIASAKKEMKKYEADRLWRNFYVERANRYILIRRRLQQWYADIFERMANEVLTQMNNARPMTNMEIAHQFKYAQA